MKERNKKLLLSLLVLVLLVSIGKETYALFTNEVSSIVQSYGTGTLKLSYSNTNINLDNAYPLMDKEGMSQDVNTITITNIGTLAYKFNVILDPSSDSTISSDLIRVSMDGESPATLSTDSNIIIRDVILNPGSSRTFTIKLWIPNTVSSSDILGKKFSAGLTSTGIAVKNMEDSDGEVLTTPTLYDYIKNNADTTTTIDFSKTSEQSNTNGIYMTTDTEGNVPVYYYRGAVDNNVLFANFCWKIIRTTETGGVKLIYNGVQKDEYEIENIDQSSYTNVENDATYPYTFDSTSKTWVSTNKTDSATGTITFSVDTDGDYVLSYVMSSETSWDKALFYKNGTKLEEHSGTEVGTIALTGLTTADIIKVEYTKDSSGSRGSDTVTFSIEKVIGTPIKSCNNTGEATTIGNIQFNTSSNSPAYVGYMYNTAHTASSKDITTLSGNIVFGNDATYDASTGKYTLKDTKTLTNPSNWGTEYSNYTDRYHYTCFSSSTTCQSVYYIHIIYSVDKNAYYFTLTNGKKPKDLLNDMFEGNINVKESNAKVKIDAWYKANMTSYTSKLEDTGFCNDRTYYNFNTSGWNKDYSNYDKWLNFSSIQRLSNRKLSLVCPRQLDKFSVSVDNGNGALTYPVGMITADEIAYAGGVIWQTNTSYYLCNGVGNLAFSPGHFTVWTAGVFFWLSDGYLDEKNVRMSWRVRPVVSLQPWIAVASGSGTATDPFVIG